MKSQDPSMHRSKVTGGIKKCDARTHGQAKSNMHHQRFQVGGKLVFLMLLSTLESLYNATRYNTVLVTTRPCLGFQMVIFLLFLYKIIPL